MVLKLESLKAAGFYFLLVAADNASLRKTFLKQ